jgi:flagellar biosynthetic protein FliR
MDLDLSTIADTVASAAWPLGRVTGLVMTAPIFAAATVPMRVRVAFVVMLTVVMLPLSPRVDAVQPLSLAGFGVMAVQVGIGAIIGFALRLVFEAVAFGGELVATSMGLNYANVVDPQHGNTTPVVGQLYTLLATLLFLVMDGHLALIHLLADSFAAIPASSGAIDRAMFFSFAGVATEIFAGALRVALPAMTAMLVVNLAFGFTSRAAPALNLFAVGFPVTLVAGFVFTWFALKGLPQTFSAMTDVAFAGVRSIFGMAP